jgi:hypothetical protein
MTLRSGRAHRPETREPGRSTRQSAPAEGLEHAADESKGVTVLLTRAESVTDVFKPAHRATPWRFSWRRLLLDTWRVTEDLGREVARVTPENGFIYAPDLVVFAAKRVPPPGMENMFGPSLRLPPAQLAALHVMPESQIDRWLSEGRFHTVVMFPNDDARLQMSGLLGRYAYHQQLHGVYILSDPTR